ncbi:MAG: carbamoyl-phosphate-synthetase [Actinomycetales bacterium]|nr:carbamoyl-phosphate-synthetase [Actinomycetales bacterium]
MSRPRILLSEGSSTNARETITALGLAGYRVDVCDPNPACLARFSRFVRRVHRCPVSGRDPVGYLRAVSRLLAEHRYDVLLPVNEQAYLFAWARDELEPLTGLAVADFAAFRRVQTKTAFLGLLDELGLAHPATAIVHDRAQLTAALTELGSHCWVKTAEGTASVGVWRVQAADAGRLWEAPGFVEELHGPHGVLVQANATGAFEQAHALFDRGRLVALRTDRRLVEGINGGPALKVGVHRPAVGDDLRRLGSALGWHGGFSVDYFWDEATGRAAYIDPNPRLTEPMNALVNGANLAELQVRLSLGEQLPSVADGTRSARSHGLIHAVLGAAADGGGRRGVLATAGRVFVQRGEYAGSREGLTPPRADPPSALATAYVVGRLVLDPARAQRMATGTIASYSLGNAVTALASATPAALGFAGPGVTGCA